MKKLYLSFLLICFLSGAGMYAYSFQYPWYTVPEKALYELSASIENLPENKAMQEWQDGLRKIETPRKALHDTGLGLITLAVLLFVLNKISAFPLKHTRTPNSRPRFIIAYLIALGLKPLWTFLYLNHRLDRFEYPTFAETIFIPIIASFIFCILMALFGSIFFLLILNKACFPANIYIWPKSHPGANIFFSLLAVIPSVLCLLYLIDAITRGSIGGVIMATTLIYLFLSARAANLNYWIEKDRQGEMNQFRA